ncbi:MAG TPA: aminomethyl-transferring glycine dehydrogenase subunit GcvPB, partial [Limnochordia bacterium]|nr:aminomethyl-transferring glycine dehydrogenase subunit GcvPB [Limnochordia bacterium]
IDEDICRLPGFAAAHPYAPEAVEQGALQLLWELEQWLCEIGGMDKVTFQPAAGAHGEFTGMLMIRAYHQKRGNPKRKVLIPDSAHGTNPATAAMCGYQVVSVKSNSRGAVDVEALKAALDDEVAALMLTNPNTAGVFDENIAEIADLVHQAGGLLYYDGANANAILGVTRPGDMGFDVVHFNLHKTFSVPHGGGGPGAGPVGVKADLIPYLPVPVVVRDGDQFRWAYDRPDSIGRVHGFYGNFGAVVRAYAYVRLNGAEGLRAIAENAVLNANYLMSLVGDDYKLPFARRCMHEFVVSAKPLRDQAGVKALDVAKRLIDFGFHPPTMYFPLIVEECLMIEPTESESVETLEAFAAAMKQIAAEAVTDPERVKRAPHTSVIGRLDEARAARRPELRW